MENITDMEKVDANDVPLDKLVFNAELGGYPNAPPRPDYVPLHPELFQYNPDFIDPAVRSGDWDNAVHEDAEQIYRWQFLTPDFCRLPVEEAEHSGRRPLFQVQRHGTHRCTAAADFHLAAIDGVERAQHRQRQRAETRTVLGTANIADVDAVPQHRRQMRGQGIVGAEHQRLVPLARPAGDAEAGIASDEGRVQMT
jgi:hypothetical protein